MIGRSTLPAAATPLVGRTADVAAVRSLLVTSRLVTLTGPPGVGKTRLAQAVAAEAVAEAPCTWVDLAPVRDAGQLMAEVARALHVRRDVAGSARGALRSVASAVGEERMLLVLDNAEHLLDGAPGLGALVASCPNLRLLVTSRERLRLGAEREVVVPPLPLPSEADVDDLARLRSTPAMALLLARAPDRVTLTERTAHALTDICVRLDGLPLALELAAARLRVFTPSELAFRLQHRTMELESGARDVPERHRDLRSAITWSHDLLPDAERAVFRRLSVFADTFTLDAAVAVCTDPSDLPPPDVAAAVGSLLDKSLIRRVEPPEGHGPESRARFSMLVSLREFGLEQLDVRGETARVRSRHADHVADLARRWEATVGTSDEAGHLPLLGPLRADLVAALGTARDDADGRPDRVLWLAAGLGWYWYTRGSLADAADLVDLVTRLAGDARTSEEARAAALQAAGVTAFGLGDLDGAARCLTRAGDLADARGDRRRRALADAFLGHVARGRGDLDTAQRHYSSARAFFEAAGDVRGTAWAGHDLGVLLADTGDDEAAESLLRESMALFAELDYPWAEAVTSRALATVLLRTSGRPDEAAALLGRALDLHVDVGDRRGIAQCLEGLADVAARRGAPATAARLLGAASSQREAAAAAATGEERAHVEELALRLSAALGRAEAARERHAGATMPASSALALAASLPRAPGSGRPGPVLTPRQREVAVLVAAGSTNRQIGRALGISEKTAEIHVRNLMERLGVSSRAAVAAWAAVNADPSPDRP